MAGKSRRENQGTKPKIEYRLSLMVATIRLFATVGRGTLAPREPTQNLVVQGGYRYVRNPMLEILTDEANLGRRKSSIATRRSQKPSVPVQRLGSSLGSKNISVVLCDP